MCASIIWKIGLDGSTHSSKVRLDEDSMVSGKRTRWIGLRLSPTTYWE